MDDLYHEILRLRANNVKQIPESFWQLTALKELILWENQIKSLPANFGQLRNLEYVI